MSAHEALQTRDVGEHPGPQDPEHQGRLAVFERRGDARSEEVDHRGRAREQKLFPQRRGEDPRLSQLGGPDFPAEAVGAAGGAGRVPRETGNHDGAVGHQVGE